MLNFYYGFMHWLPFALMTIGFIMRILPKKKGFSSRNKSMNGRQFFGGVLFYPSLVFTLMQFGASRPTWFYESPNGKYVYSCFALTDSAAADTAKTVATDSVATDSTGVVIACNDTLKIASDSSAACTYKIPFEEVNNVKYITIVIGTAKIRAMYDTGCSYDIAFAPKDYYKLVGAGVVEENKYTGTTQSVIANGTVVTNGMFMLPSCIIGNIKFSNKEVCAMSMGESTLVGSSMFKNFKTTSIDNENHQIILTK